MHAATSTLSLRFGLAAVLALNVSTHAARAQSATLDARGGGALPGVTAFDITGPAGAEYLLLLAVREESTPLPGLGITLEVPLDLLGPSFQLPNFFGTFDGGGAATATLPLPAVPEFEDFPFSLQALFLNGGTYGVSNLIRTTPQLVGTFRPSLEAPVLPIAGGAAAASADGEFVFFGGSGPVAQTYASRTEEWRLSGATTEFGLFSQTTALDDGRVLLTGGIDPATGQPTTSASLFDPATGTTTTLSMLDPRAGHGASRLPDGRVLITGGFSTLALGTDLLALFNGVLGTTEVFDPATDTFAPGPGLLEPRALHTSTTAQNGRVLIAGGITLVPIVGVPTISATAYSYNPTTGSFGLPSFFSGARFLHSATALTDGRVLLAGGLTLDLTTFLTSGDLADLGVSTRTDCQVFSQGLFGSGQFATVPGLQAGRAGSAIAPLPGGRALIAGGIDVTIDASTQTFGFAVSETADLFVSGPDAVAATGSMAAPRFLANALGLPDGTVLVVGGGGPDSEIYQPE